jgi:hypothetical protein
LRPAAPGDELLARAGLAQDEDVRLRARRLLHQLEDLADGRARPDDVLEAQGLLELAAEVPVLQLETALAQRALDRDAQLLDREVLGQVVERALAHRAHRRFDRREGGDHDHRQGGVQLVGPPEQDHAVDLRHLQIGEQDVRALGLEELEGAARFGRAQAAIVGALQRAHTVLHHVGLVVYDDDGGARHGHPGVSRITSGLMARTRDHGDAPGRAARVSIGSRCPWGASSVRRAIPSGWPPGTRESS